jgi:hypothetical protein
MGRTLTLLRRPLGLVLGIGGLRVRRARWRDRLRGGRRPRREAASAVSGWRGVGPSLTLVRCPCVPLNSPNNTLQYQWPALQTQPQTHTSPPHRHPKDQRRMDIYSPNMQREALLKFAEALGSRRSALMRDECGDWRIEGNRGHIYAVPGALDQPHTPGFQIYFGGAGVEKGWLNTIRVTPRPVACGPAPVTRLPGPVPGTCFAGPLSPWPPSLARPAPRRITPLCSSASLLLRRSQTSRVRASSASTPRLPDADLGRSPSGQTRDLPVPAQRASTHARVFDHAGLGGRSHSRARPCRLP